MPADHMGDAEYIPGGFVDLRVIITSYKRSLDYFKARILERERHSVLETTGLVMVMGLPEVEAICRRLDRQDPDEALLAEHLEAHIDGMRPVLERNDAAPLN